MAMAAPTSIARRRKRTRAVCLPAAVKAPRQGDVVRSSRSLGLPRRPPFGLSVGLSGRQSAPSEAFVIRSFVSIDTRPRTSTGAGLERSAQTASKLGEVKASLSIGLTYLLMREYVRVGPSQQVEAGPRRKKAEASFGDLVAIFPLQHRIETLAQRVQMQDVGGGIGDLSLRQRGCAQSEDCCCFDKSMLRSSRTRSFKPCRSV